MYMYTKCMPGTHRSQSRVSDVMELQLWMVLNQVLWKSRKCSQPLSYNSRVCFVSSITSSPVHKEQSFGVYGFISNFRKQVQFKNTCPQYSASWKGSDSEHHAFFTFLRVQPLRQKFKSAYQKNSILSYCRLMKCYRWKGLGRYHKVLPFQKLALMTEGSLLIVILFQNCLYLDDVSHDQHMFYLINNQDGGYRWTNQEKSKPEHMSLHRHQDFLNMTT